MSLRDQKTGPLQVLVDLRALQPGYKAHFGRGIGRVVQELVRRLPVVAKALDLRGLVQGGLDPPDKSFMGNYPHNSIKMPWPRSRALDRLLGQEIALPLVTGRQGCLTHYMAHLDGPAFGGGPTVVTVHDLILARKAGEMAKGGWARRIIRGLEARAARRAELVVTVSETTAQEVTKYLGVVPDKIRVIHSAAGEQFGPVHDLKHLEHTSSNYGLPPAFILTVGGFDPRKNLPRLIRAWKRVAEPIRRNRSLVFVGSLADKDQAAPVLEEIENQGVSDSVRLLGQVSDKDLPTIYNLATALVFPSFYEGFGLPALEAMSCGCPVLASRAAALPEVAGDAGLYFNPHRTDEITEAMSRALTDPILLKELKHRGFERAGQFTWDKAAEDLVGVYREALEGLAS